MNFPFQGRTTKIGQGGRNILSCTREASAKIYPPHLSDSPPLGMIFAPSGPAFLVWDMETTPSPPRCRKCENSGKF